MIPSLEKSWALMGDLKLLRNRTVYEKLIGKRVIDALFFMPSRLITRTPIPSLEPCYHQSFITAGIKISGYASHPRAFIQPRYPFRIQGTFVSMSDSQTIQPLVLIFFNGNTAYLKATFPIGKTVFFNGKLSYSARGKTFSVAHPTLILPPEKTSFLPNGPKFEAIYPSTAFSNSNIIRLIVQSALASIPNLPEWIPQPILKEKHWPPWDQAIRQAHAPQNEADLELTAPARERLVFDELLAQHLTIRIHAAAHQEQAPLLSKTELVDVMLKNLPFQMTQSQKGALQEIQKDLQNSKPMLRLLQGDVGSGKTVVALAAAAQAIHSGYQTAFLAPTDILAKQHFESAQALLSLYRIRIVLYTADQKGAEREKILKGVANGSIDLLIGTHTLIQDSVVFGQLGLVVIDEQQRFGVTQRFKLAHKIREGQVPHILSISATPIPRTLLLSQHSNMAISYLKEKPSDRHDILTRVIPIERLDALTQSLQNVIDKAQQIYWVCPLVEDSETLDLTSATERFLFLQKHFGEKVALVHGQLKNAEKQKIMQRFYQNHISILVATTVIEIGVDAPNATVMIIEHAERFGLGQLHQLRGRVGRGSSQASCILLYGKKITDLAKKRLMIIRNCTDGFKIAELDLILRGAGDIFGTQQSGALTSKLLPNIASSMKNYMALLQTYSNLSTLAAQTASDLLVSPVTPTLQILLDLFSPTVQQNDLRKAG